MVSHMCLLSYWNGYGITYVSLIILELVWYDICVYYHTGMGMVSHISLLSYWNGYGITYKSLIILELVWYHI